MALSFDAGRVTVRSSDAEHKLPWTASASRPPQVGLAAVSRRLLLRVVLASPTRTYAPVMAVGSGEAGRRQPGSPGLSQVQPRSVFAPDPGVPRIEGRGRVAQGGRRSSRTAAEVAVGNEASLLRRRLQRQESVSGVGVQPSRCARSLEGAAGSRRCSSDEPRTCGWVAPVLDWDSPEVWQRSRWPRTGWCPLGGSAARRPGGPAARRRAVELDELVNRHRCLRHERLPPVVIWRRPLSITAAAPDPHSIAARWTSLAKVLASG